MEVLRSHCAGLDVHKDSVVAVVRHMVDGEVQREVRTFRTTTTWPDRTVGVTRERQEIAHVAHDVGVEDIAGAQQHGRTDLRDTTRPIFSCKSAV
jgi:hypothetical protein